MADIFDQIAEAGANRDIFDAIAGHTEAPLSTQEKILGYSRSVLAGPTLNFADNLEAAVAAPFTDLTYDQELKTIRAQQSRFKRLTPYLANAVELATGAILNPLTELKAAKTVAGPGISTLKSFLTSAPAQAAIAGAGAANGEDVLETAAGSALVGSGVSALGSILGKTLGQTARNADRFKLSAYGIGTADLNKQLRKLGDEAAYLGDAGQMPLVQTLNRAERQGLIDVGEDALTNAGKIAERQDELGSSLGNLLEQADKASTPKVDFGLDNTIKYIQGLTGTAREKATAAADAELSAIISQLKTGTLKDLQDVKRGLNYKFDQNPYTDDVIKALRSDLRAEIEKRVDDLGTAGIIPQSTVGKVKSLNSEWGSLAELRDAFVRRGAKDIQGNPIEDIIRGGSTTGGVGSMTQASASSGNPIYAGIGALLSAARGPEALSTLGDILRDPAVNIPMKLAGKLLPEILTARNVAQGKSAFQEKKNEQSQLNALLNQVLSNKENKSLDPKVLSTPTPEANMTRSPEFDAKVQDIAARLEVNPDHLLKAMAFETGGTFDAAIKNQAGSGATGLIQFMPATAKELTGADTRAAAIKILSDMTPTEQLDYVEKYLKPFKGKLKSLEDLYMAILYPKAVGKDPEYALFKEGTNAYWQNRGLDLNRDGVITKLEASNKVKLYKV